MALQTGLLILLIPSMALALEIGDTCTDATKLPPDMYCIDGVIGSCKEPVGNIEIARCAAMEREAIDKKLNQTYRKILGRLSPEGKASLIEAQKAWVQFKIADCKDQSRRDTSVEFWQYVSIDGCDADLTRQRLQTLERRYGTK